MHDAGPNAMARLTWAAGRSFAWGYGVIKDLTGRNLPGLGHVLRRIEHPHRFTAQGLSFEFDPRIGTAYQRLIGGGWNEPETHRFLHRVLDAYPDSVRFIEVGANIGEILVSVLRHDRVVDAVAFEPNPLCAQVARRHLALNGLTNARVIERAVADGRPAHFSIDDAFPVRSALSFDDSNADGQPTLTIDEVIAEWPASSLVVLVDAEGAELAIFRGMERTLARFRPLIVFEFNELGRDGYGEQAVREVLGPGYTLHRLRIDGRLDDRLDRAWNAVAVPRNTRFAELCSELIASG